MVVMWIFYLAAIVSTGLAMHSVNKRGEPFIEILAAIASILGIIAVGML